MPSDEVFEAGSGRLDRRNYCVRFGREGTTERRRGAHAGVIPLPVQRGKDLQLRCGGGAVQPKTDGLRR